MWFTRPIRWETLASLNPATKEYKEYKAPGTINTRGVAVDAQDNIWYSNFHGHKLAKLDQKTGIIKQYEPPTQRATYYGVVVERKTGYIWCADVPTGTTSLGLIPRPSSSQSIPFRPPTPFHDSSMWIRVQGRCGLPNSSPVKSASWTLEPAVSRWLLPDRNACGGESK